MTVHDVEVEEIGFFLDFRYLFAEPGEIGRQQARGDPKGSHWGFDCIGLVPIAPVAKAAIGWLSDQPRG